MSSFDQKMGFCNCSESNFNNPLYEIFITIVHEYYFCVDLVNESGSNYRKAPEGGLIHACFQVVSSFSFM